MGASLGTKDYFDYDKSDSQLVGAPGIKINTSLKLLKSEWPLDKIWNQETAFDKEESCLAVWALDDRYVRTQSLTTLQYEILHLLFTTHNVETAISEVSHLEEAQELANVFQDSFSAWTKQGIIQSLG